ncbi:SAM-dependent methyltransferase [Campylobacter fetus subsp. testudinum]|uniref:methyltransferase regulatory domain-containing protein n=1 Tax=Campylobacter fetus TaxID=196 RepID=UPI00081882EE|nr:methyltransferase regulatory domain-containing protein [Campylobacter fetus]OCS00514.1 SAM-dependent methyltransferase [Campylobacter fetus subsp. testudinum]
MINDLIKQTYDETMYDSNAFAQTSTESMFDMAKIYGLTPPDPNFANVLEIGCAMGGNIIGQAINHPNSHFIGIDISDKQIEVGKNIIQNVGCKNIELQAIDIMDLVKIYKGKKSFDYIICHGIYSWVPGFVRAGILEAMRELLSEQGVGFISYNCYPGWKYVEPIRDFMRFSAANVDEKDKLQTALNAFKFEKAYYASSNTNGDVMQTLTRQIKLENINIIENTPNRSYLAHEYIEICNQPFYFTDFVADLEDFGLSYIADMMMYFSLDEFRSEALKEFAKLSYPDRIAKEQMFDFLYSTRFRSSLITKKSNEPNLVFDDKSKEQNIKDMHIMLGSPCTEFLERVKGSYLEPLMKVLADAYPASVSAAKCIELAKKDDFMAEFYDIKAVTNSIFCTSKELKNISYRVGKSRLKQIYIPYLTHFMNSKKQGVGIATPLNGSMELEKIEIGAILMFDGKNSLKDIQSALKVKFKKEKIYPTIIQNGTQKILTSSKEQDEYFKDRVRKIAEQLSLVYMFEEF